MNCTDPNCTHKACAKVRFFASAECYYCVNPIGFDEPYVEIGSHTAHTACARSYGSPSRSAEARPS
jgi:hypothetical protein